MLPVRACRGSDTQRLFPVQLWAGIEARCGDAPRARELMAAAANAPGAGAAQLVAWGRFEERQGSAFEAMRLFRRALQADPDSAPAVQVPPALICSHHQPLACGLHRIAICITLGATLSAFCCPLRLSGQPNRWKWPGNPRQGIRPPRLWI